MSFIKKKFFSLMKTLENFAAIPVLQKYFLILKNIVLILKKQIVSKLKILVLHLSHHFLIYTYYINLFILTFFL